MEKELFGLFSEEREEQKNISRRDFLKNLTFIAIGTAVPSVIKNKNPDYRELTEQEKQELKKEFEAKELQTYLDKVLSQQYIGKKEGKNIVVPVRDSLRIENDSLIYTLPFEWNELKNIPSQETESGKRDSRKYFPLSSFYFYRGKGARFDNKYLTGNSDEKRPEKETKIPLLDEKKEFDLPKKLSAALDSLDIASSEIKEKKNIIISKFSKRGNGSSFVYVDGKLLFNARISGAKRRGTTMGIYPEISPYAPWKKSKTYDDFPMPYALHYGKYGEFIHAGNTRGYSHGCTRMEGIKSALLWRLVMDKKEGEDSFGLINIREDQTGKDLNIQETTYGWVGYKSEFIDKIHLSNNDLLKNSIVE